jgi:general secretion pathway protein A
VLQSVLDTLHRGAVVGYVGHHSFDDSSVLETILGALDVEAGVGNGENRRRLFRYLVEVEARGQTCVVAIDEAQNLDLDMLEAIRMLLNYEKHGQKLIQIILAGQPKLAETLARPECEQIRQRIDVVSRLEPLSPEQVWQYITHRLRVAGASSELFSPEAVVAIAAGSQGIPRNINRISFHALTAAFGRGKKQVGRSDVAEVLRALDLAAGQPSGLPQSDRGSISGLAQFVQSLTGSMGYRLAAIAGSVLIVLVCFLISRI